MSPHSADGNADSPLDRECTRVPETAGQAEESISKLTSVNPEDQLTVPPKTDAFASANQTKEHEDGKSDPDDGLPAIAGYDILAILGRGGMGVVYKARHLKLKRLVALKMILAGAHAGPDQATRFLIEAEAVARLQHPNIVQIHEIGEQNGLPFFSLEYVDGGSLDKKLAGNPQDPRVAAALVQTLAQAMHAAHQAGVIHRDLKPANVLLARDGTPKITDFGLAKQLDSAVGQTQSGAVMGTPSYMAPEQAGGKTKEIGPAADVYALGAILYEMLTGRPPFKAATPLDTIMQVVADEPVPPSRLQAKVPRDLETICLKCLEKEPEKRYASAGEAAADLERWLGGEPTRARHSTRRERLVKWVRRRPALAALLAVGCVALLALGGALWLYRSWQVERYDTLVEQAQAALNRREWDKVHELLDKCPGWLRDGRWDDLERQAYMGRVKDHCQAGRPDEAESLLDMVPESLRDPGWRDYKSSLRRPAVLLTPDWSQWGGNIARPVVAVSADGTRVAVADFLHGSGYILDVNTQKPVATFIGSGGYVRQLRFSPDGRWLAAATNSHLVDGKDNGVIIWDAARGKEGRYLPSPVAIDALAFTDGSRRLATVHWNSARSNDLLWIQAEGGGTMTLWNVADGKELRSSRFSGKAMVAYRPQTFAEDGGRFGWFELHIDAVRTKQKPFDVWYEFGYAGVRTLDVASAKEYAAGTAALFANPVPRYWHNGPVPLALSLDLRRVIAWKDFDMTVRDVPGGKELARFPAGAGQRQTECSAAFSRDGNLVAWSVGFSEPSLRVGDLRTKKMLALRNIRGSIRQPDQPLVGSLAWGPKGRLVAATNTSVHVFDLSGGIEAANGAVP